MIIDDRGQALALALETRAVINSLLAFLRNGADVPSARIDTAEGVLFGHDLPKNQFGYRQVLILEGVAKATEKEDLPTVEDIQNIRERGVCQAKRESALRMITYFSRTEGRALHFRRHH